MKVFRRLFESQVTKWCLKLAESVCLGKGPQSKAPLVGAVAAKLCGAAPSIMVLLSMSWPSLQQAQICLVVNPQSSILRLAGMKTKVNNPP